MNTKKTWSIITYKVAMIATYVLSVVLFICANTNSCCMVYQPKTPDGLENYSHIR